MVDEAEQQLYLSADKIRTAVYNYKISHFNNKNLISFYNQERLEAERIIERLKQQHEAEITSLQMSLNKMILVLINLNLIFVYYQLI